MNPGVYLYAGVFLPLGVCKADVVEFGPASEHLLFGDEAVMVATVTLLIQKVGQTFVLPARLVVVIRHPFGLRVPPAA